ncbi:hypothetical protein EVAR_102586_1 [Eumeta japonica]|uniref:Uncharacterized protein n=1 Tax=Eumeta variegata TaxID=151549 RepID=A0A4C1TV12_EUMVA|nr:hypothetical protein EVAR_102586_1 [Eumeta japonica]
MNTRNSRRVTGMLPASCEEVGYPMKRGAGSAAMLQTSRFVDGPPLARWPPHFDFTLEDTKGAVDVQILQNKLLG